jgi:hypothetical protein
MHLQ